MSPTVGHPHSAIARSTSALQQLEHASALRSRRPAASPQTTGRPNEHGAGAERDRLDDIGPAPDAAVEQHLDAPVDRLRHVRQRANRRDGRVELPAAVVRDDDAGRAAGRRPGRRRRRGRCP